MAATSGSIDEMGAGRSNPILSSNRQNTKTSEFDISWLCDSVFSGYSGPILMME